MLNVIWEGVSLKKVEVKVVEVKDGGKNADMPQRGYTLAVMNPKKKMKSGKSENILH